MKNKRKIIIAITIIFIIITGNIINVFAATNKELKQQQQENQNNIQSTKDKQKEIKNQMSSIQKEVEDLNTQIGSYENEIIDLTGKIEDATKNIQEMEQEIEKTQKDLEEKEKLLEKRLVASYKAGNTSYLDVLLSSDSLTSFLSNYYLVEQLAESDTKLINTIKETKETIEESKKIIEESKKELEVAKEAQESKKAALAVVRNEKNEKVESLSEEDKALEKKIEEMRAEDATIAAAIRANEERQAAQAQAAANANKGNQSTNSNTSNNGNNQTSGNQSSGNTSSGGNSTATNPGGYILPIPAQYALVTAGWRYSSGKLHKATDFGAGGIHGAPVYAAKAGTVITTMNRTDSYGTYVVIAHNDGTYTLYGHGIRGSICVSVGQEVSQGQQIMQVGNTGNSFGSHLHFEIRLAPGNSDNRVNPLNYLPMDNIRFAEGVIKY